MNLLDSFLWGTVLAYLACLPLPKVCMKGTPLLVERIFFFFVATLISIALILKRWYIWISLGTIYVSLASLSYLGYQCWNVLWKDVSDEAQMFMATWDLLIAIAFLKHL